MIAKGLMIFWDKATEYINIDIDSINEETTISKTIEYWQSTKSFVGYSTESHIRKEGSTYILSIRYKHDLNTQIPEKDACWGQSEIYITPGATSGKGTWSDDKFPGEYNGTTVWRAIENSLYKLPAKEVISRLKRNQRALRQALLAMGASCAITGETTIASLEAAHIIPSAKLGSEVIENSILLRADIHKLFDKKLFSISSTGEILNVSDKLSEYYKTLLQGRRLDNESIERVKMAIEATLELKVNKQG